MQEYGEAPGQHPEAFEGVKALGPMGLPDFPPFIAEGYHCVGRSMLGPDLCFHLDVFNAQVLA